MDEKSLLIPTNLNTRVTVKTKMLLSDYSSKSGESISSAVDNALNEYLNKKQEGK